MLRNMGSKDALAGPPSSAGEKSVAEVFRSDEQPPPTPARLHKRKSWTASSREVWEYREVLYFLVLRNLKVRYRQTVLGAAQLAIESKKSPEDLIKMVVTPGGTTAAGLAKMEKLKTTEGLIAAVEAATNRGREMAREFLS